MTYDIARMNTSEAALMSRIVGHSFGLAADPAARAATGLRIRVATRRKVTAAEARTLLTIAGIHSTSLFAPNSLIVSGTRGKTGGL